MERLLAKQEAAGSNPVYHTMEERFETGDGYPLNWSATSQETWDDFVQHWFYYQWTEILNTEVENGV